ncbi:hypothetical protein JOC85_004133 [Bacillus mesophilus]|nr:hypothetical protein [Bacillus mesophilus]
MLKDTTSTRGLQEARRLRKRRSPENEDYTWGLKE